MKNLSITIHSKVALLFLLFSSGIILGQNENDAVRLAVPGIISNARALGMGNSTQTRSGDFSAMVLNPAGLALSQHSKLSGGFYYRFLGNTSTFYGNSGYEKNSSMELSEFSYLYKEPTTRGSLVYGFGYKTDKDFTSALRFNGYNPNNNSMIQDLTNKNDDLPYNLGLSYPLVNKDTTHINGGLSQSGVLFEEGSIGRYSFGAGIEVAKGAYFGGSVNFLSGNYSNDREYYEDDWDDYYTAPTDVNDENTRNFETFHINDAISWDLSAWELRFGFIIDWLDFVRIGGSAKLPTTYYIREKYYIEGFSKFDSDYYIDLNPTESEIEYKIKTPLEFSLGTSVDLSLVNINAQATFVDYSQLEFSGDLEASAIKTNNRIINANLKSVLNLNLGAEVKIPLTGISARAGIMYYPSPYKEDTKNFNKVFLNAGVGISVSNALQFDVAYSYGFWDTYSDNYGAGQSRVFQSVASHTILITTTIAY